MLTNLEIAFAVLGAVFGAVILAFIIYIIVKRCCARQNRESLPVLWQPTTTDTYNVAFRNRSSYLTCQRSNPQYTCRFRRQTLDVFSCNLAKEDSPLSDVKQLALTAALQHCYEAGYSETSRADSVIAVEAKPTFGVAEVPLIEDIHVIPLQKARQSLIGPGASSDIRPRTYVNLKEIEEWAEQKSKVDVRHGMFICKSVGREGGTVELYGVVLSISPGALSKEEKISLGVVWTADHQPPLASREAGLSPVVSCEPHGLRLATAATLTLPHCAADVSSDWLVKVLCSDTTLGSKPDWTTLNEEQVQVLPSKIQLTLNHFTLYTVTGEPATVAARKWVELVAFASPLTGTLFPIRMYCINDYSADDARDTKKMNKTETKQKGKEVSSPMPLQFYNDENNLRVNLDKMADSWSLSGIIQNPQEMDFDQVWHGLGPSCKFVLQSGSLADTVQCCFQCYQIGHEEKKQTLIVSEERSLSKDSRIEPKTLYAVFPPELCDTIMKMLDPTLVMGNNWIALAEVLDMSLTESTWLEHDYKEAGRSPTVYLLNLWAKQGKTLDQFQSTMKSLQRLDVVDEIEKWREKTDKQ